MLSISLVSCNKEDKIVVRFAVTSGQIAQAIERLQFKTNFENENPDIKVDIVILEGGYDDLRPNNYGYQYRNDTAPDIVIGYPDHFAEYYGGGALVNLQTFIDDPVHGYTDEELNDFLESYLAENRGFNSQNPNDLYGLPFNKSSEVLIYNKTAFELLFGDNWEEKVPETWDDLYTVSLEIIDLVKAGELDNHWEIEADNPDTPEDETKYLKVSDYFKNKFAPFGYDSSANAFITLTRQWGGIYRKRKPCKGLCCLC